MIHWSSFHSHFTLIRSLCLSSSLFLSLKIAHFEHMFQIHNWIMILGHWLNWKKSHRLYSLTKIVFYWYARYGLIIVNGFLIWNYKIYHRVFSTPDSDSRLSWRRASNKLFHNYLIINFINHFKCLTSSIWIQIGF